MSRKYSVQLFVSAAVLECLTVHRESPVPADAWSTLEILVMDPHQLRDLQEPDPARKPSAGHLLLIRLSIVFHFSVHCAAMQME